MTRFQVQNHMSRLANPPGLGTATTSRFGASIDDVGSNGLTQAGIAGPGQDGIRAGPPRTLWASGGGIPASTGYEPSLQCVHRKSVRSARTKPYGRIMETLQHVHVPPTEDNNAASHGIIMTNDA